MGDDDTKKTDKSINVKQIEEKLTMSAMALKQFARPCIAILEFVLPWIFKGCGIAYAFWNALPKNVARFLTGAIFCFFGGVYPVTFAAVQAAEHGGRAKVVESVKVLAEQATKIIEASKKDDEQDADGDGKKDVAQLSTNQYLMHKLQLVLTKMDPQKVNDAIGTIYTVWLSVLAVLSVEFARTIAMALSIAEFLYKPLNRYVAPTIEMALPADYKKWVPVVIGWICKSIAMSIAWYIQSVISAFTSALTGGLMMARAIYAFLAHRGIRLGGWIPENDEDSYLDEIMSYIFAGLGFYVQIMNNFEVPFPLDLVLWPLSIVEYYLKWTITKKH